MSAVSGKSRNPGSAAIGQVATAFSSKSSPTRRSIAGTSSSVSSSRPLFACSEETSQPERYSVTLRREALALMRQSGHDVGRTGMCSGTTAPTHWGRRYRQFGARRKHIDTASD